ncbi:MAG: hypothetical protein EAZ99_16540 [Alphaproteobacteria bacterium]|nr:MAG: hypothetical protein EAZ99_16540 [Alphaproteobacteria bacterium]
MGLQVRLIGWPLLLARWSWCLITARRSRSTTLNECYLAIAISPAASTWVACRYTWLQRIEALGVESLIVGGGEARQGPPFCE